GRLPRGLEESSGRDLQAWSKEWLETAGVNTLRPSAAHVGGRFGSVTILQEAPPDNPTLRSHRLAVGLYDDDAGKLVRRRRVELDVVGRETEVPGLAGEAVPALTLLNDDDLTYAKIRLDDASFANLARRLKDLPDSLPRALSWAATWDMVRDAELPTRDYVGLVVGNIDGETQVAVVEKLLGQAGSAVHFFGDPANHDAALDGLATAAWQHLAAAAPGSDHQLAWARAFAGFARSPEHLAAVRGLLDETVTFEGLAIDTDLRWMFVRYLAAAGAAGEALIEEELRRDPT